MDKKLVEYLLESKESARELYTRWLPLLHPLAYYSQDLNGVLDYMDGHPGVPVVVYAAVSSTSGRPYIGGRLVHQGDNNTITVRRISEILEYNDDG
jgi:hypothetical protein